MLSRQTISRPKSALFSQNTTTPPSSHAHRRHPLARSHPPRPPNQPCVKGDQLPQHRPSTRWQTSPDDNLNEQLRYQVIMDESYNKVVLPLHQYHQIFMRALRPVIWCPTAPLGYDMQYKSNLEKNLKSCVETQLNDHLGSGTSRARKE